MSTGLYPVGLFSVALSGDYVAGAPDTVAPVLTDPPTVASITDTAATGSVSTNESGGFLFVLVSESPSETDAAVYATGDTQAVTAAGAQSIPLTGLTPATDLYLYVGHRDPALNEAVVVRSVLFTTQAEADVTAPILTLPTGSNTGTASGLGTVTTDTAEGTLYYLTSTNASESAATVKAASNQPVTAAGLQNITITGLSAGTGFYNHYVHRDASGNDSLVSSSAQWFTEDEVPAEGALALTNPLAHVLKNFMGSPFASVDFRCIIVNKATGALVAIKTGTTTSGALLGTLTDPALVVGTEYYVIVEPGTGGEYGIHLVTAT